MLATLVGFFDLLLASLVAGAMFGAWLVLNPKGLDGPGYIRLQQQGIRKLNIVMPALGAATFVLTAIAAWLARSDGVRLDLLATAALGFLAAGLITRFLSQPINSVVMSWSAEAPPMHWRQMRDQWWRWHVIRLTCGIGGLCALILAGSDVLAMARR